MKGTICVVKLKVSSRSAVFLDVDGIHGHGVRVSAEDSRLVHVIPEAVHVVAALEDLVVKQASPVFLSILVEEVDPG